MFIYITSYGLYSNNVVPSACCDSLYVQCTAAQVSNNDFKQRRSFSSCFVVQFRGACVNDACPVTVPVYCTPIKWYSLYRAATTPGIAM